MKRFILMVLALLVPVVSLAQTTSNNTFIRVTPTIQASPDYSTGDLVGGKLTFFGALSSLTGTGIVVGGTIADNAAQVPDVDLVIFESDPSNTTFTENSALDIADADLKKIVAIISFRSDDQYTFASNGIEIASGKAKMVRALTPQGRKNSTLYGAMVVRETYNAAAVDDLTVTLHTLAN